MQGSIVEKVLAGEAENYNDYLRLAGAFQSGIS